MQSSSMQASPSGWRAVAASAARIAGLPLGGFAAPPPALFEAIQPEPHQAPRAPIPRRRAAAVAQPVTAIRWTALSAVR